LIVPNKRINILFKEGLTLNLKAVRWWELPVGDEVYFIDPILDACWLVLQDIIGADALDNYTALL